MTDASGKSGPMSNVRSLADAMRKVRMAESERMDVIVDLRDAERARLELLADELRGVFADVPEGDEQFIFQVSSGSQPRFWVDMTSLVTMARDRRTYRFLKDTRLGRTVILETADIDDMADCITQYVAERIIERERALEGDWLQKRIAAQDGPPEKAERAVAGLLKAQPLSSPPRPRLGTAWIASAFLAGMLVGVIGLFAYAWMRIG